MKKILAISLLALSLTGCGATAPVETPEVESTSYIMAGRYYFNADLQGQVVTSDGNVWEYTQDIISKEPAYHNEPIFAVINDNGTPDIIEDDEVLGVVLDRETAIYDALEAEFSKSETIEVKREGNVLTMSMRVAE